MDPALPPAGSPAAATRFPSYNNKHQREQRLRHTRSLVRSRNVYDVLLTFISACAAVSVQYTWDLVSQTYLQFVKPEFLIFTSILVTLVLVIFIAYIFGARTAVNDELDTSKQLEPLLEDVHTLSHAQQDTTRDMQRVLHEMFYTRTHA